VCILTLKGRLDTNTSRHLRERWSQLIEEGQKHFVVDAAELIYVSSSGLGELLLAAKSLKDSGGAIVVCNLNDRIQEIFAMTGFSKLFTVYNSVEEAVQSLGALA
jgi:anti-sigma B factor antagonist